MNFSKYASLGCPSSLYDVGVMDSVVHNSRAKLPLYSPLLTETAVEQSVNDALSQRC